MMAHMVEHMAVAEDTVDVDMDKVYADSAEFLAEESLVAGNLEAWAAFHVEVDMALDRVEPVLVERDTLVEEKVVEKGFAAVQTAELVQAFADMEIAETDVYWV